MRRLVLVVGDRAALPDGLPRSLQQLDLPSLPITAEQAVAWATHHPNPVLFCDAAACREVRLRRSTNLLPVVQFDEGPGDSLSFEPDARLEGDGPQQVLRAVAHALSAHSERLAAGALADLRVSLPSCPDELEELLTAVGPWFRSCGLGEHRTRQLTLAVREVGANSIEWGHRYQRALNVHIHCRLDAEKLTVFLRDHGPGFDRLDLPHAARYGDPCSHLAVRAARNLREGGFGILMASGLVDQLCYNESGNEALLVTYLPGAGQHAEDDLLLAPVPAATGP